MNLHRLPPWRLKSEPLPIWHWFCMMTITVILTVVAIAFLVLDLTGVYSPARPAPTPRATPEVMIQPPADWLGVDPWSGERDARQPGVD